MSRLSVLLSEMREEQTGLLRRATIQIDEGKYFMPVTEEMLVHFTRGQTV